MAGIIWTRSFGQSAGAWIFIRRKTIGEEFNLVKTPNFVQLYLQKFKIRI